MKHTEPRAYPAQDSVFISIYFFCFIAACYHAAVYNCLRRFSGEIVAEERF
mgnify:CR=1 FL=1